ncbi:MAG: protein-export chaperone SecB [Acholeplasmatales bacterium]|nr:protein-export chaperone SecB [Acholeplasmatales bacterium]
MDTINSNLMLKNMAFTNISVKRSFDLPNNLDIMGSFDVRYEEIDDNEIIVVLKYLAKSKKEEISIDIELKGNFVTRDIEDKKVSKYLLHVNSLAIMFPYLRSQISIVTTQPGFVPIQIPIINAVALAREAGFEE